MSFDSSRFTYDPWKDYCGVVMEQGRVQLDSDWNEWLAELDRRVRAGTLDTFGRAVYPSTTPYAFKIYASGGALSIGAGRMYVDGLLAENHGPEGSAQWDPALDEMSGAPQISGVAAVTVDYAKQPYLPGASLPAGNGPFLVYLDVWRRAVTYLEDPSLVDQAVNVDTTGRLQTVWQVKLLDVSGVAGGVTCSTPDSSIPAWLSLIQPSAGQLTTGVANSTPPGPCCLASNTGYTGMENQLYRVQIHNAGTPGGKPAATFKWSRDNGSVQTSVTAIATVTNTAGNAASQLSVASMGRDQVLGFAPGNWIEIIDDYQELNGHTGELHLIDSIDFAQKTITLDSTISAASYPLTSGKTDATRHTRITRWDQSGQVFEKDGVTVWTDLGAAGATGDIPVPPAGTTLILENGVAVTFGVNPANGAFHTGDCWTFAARTADGSVETLNQAYPQGIHHHYARLSVVTFPSTASDCRVEWPPAPGGNDCCCTVTVKPADLTNGATLQTIIDRYRNQKTSTEICLMAGNYPLEEPLRFTADHSHIGLKACQDGQAVLRVPSGHDSAFFDGMIVFDNTTGVSLRGLSFSVPVVNYKPHGGKFAGVAVDSLERDAQIMLNNLVVSIGVRTVNVSGFTMENCSFTFRNFGKVRSERSEQWFGVGIFAGGQSSDWRVTGTRFAGGGSFLAGIAAAPNVEFAPAAGKPMEAPILETVGPAIPEGPAAAEIEAGARGAKTALAGTDVGQLLTRFQSIFNRGTSALASHGGTVLPSSLDLCVFENNEFDGCTVGMLFLGSTRTVDCSRNEFENCDAGVWTVSALQAGLIPYDPNNVALAGLSIAMGYPLPAKDTTTASQFVKVPAAPASVRIYAGSKTFTDSQSNRWLPDVSAPGVKVSGGVLNQPANPKPIVDASPSTNDQALYQDERWGNSFSYTFTKLPAGYYQVTLRFAEIFYTNEQTDKGVRIFNVSINDNQVLNGLDVVTDAGGANTADDWVFSNVAPDADGNIVIQFQGTTLGADQNAKIGAVSVEPQWNGMLPQAVLESFTSTPGTLQFYWQLAELAQQGFVSAQPPMALRLDANEMAGLSAPGVLVLGDDQTQTPNTGSLLMSGNRISGSIPYPIGELTDARYELIDFESRYFLSVAAIAWVMRPVVTSNLITNEATIDIRKSAYDSLRYAFALNAGPGDPQANPTPGPEIMVSANVFQGRMMVIPARFAPAAEVPAPMNAWSFLNTVIP